MGKPSGKKKQQVVAQKPGDPTGKASKPSKAAFDEDTAVFISMSQELKEEGNKLFQKHDHEGAMLKYEKALKLLPRNHIDVAYLRSNMAACYMQLGLGEYPRAINQCNLALEVSPKYSKALLKRAKCYEALNRLDLALRDVNNVLSMEPNNLTALEIAGSVKRTMSERGIVIEDKEVVLESVETPPVRKLAKEKSKKKRSGGKGEEKKAEDKAVLEEEMNAVKVKEVILKTVEEEEEITKSVKEEHVVVTRTAKLVLGEDIRWAQLPVNCSIRLVREIVVDRFPNLKGVLVKYKDQEGDLITITTTNELRMAEAMSDHNGSLRLYIAEVMPEQEPSYEGLEGEEELYRKYGADAVENGDVEEEKDGKNDEKGKAEGSTCIEDWILQFARLFKNHVGFDSDSYLDLHEIGMKLYSEAMEDTVTTEDAQQLFDIASEKFQEMAALALFNWGNVHLSRARKLVFFSEDISREAVLAKIHAAYEWALKEYVKAGSRYEEALRIKPDFYEGLLALGQQQFEQAKLCWYYAIGTKVELNDGPALEDGPASEVLMLYNKAEDSMEKGMQMWEEMEERRLNGLSKSEKYKAQLEKMGLDGLLKEISADEASEQASNMSSQIYLLWGTLLYERSVVEYRLELPTWEECLEVAVEKFELAGASQTDIAVMIKNHCSNETAIGGFKIDEIVHAWNEMYDARRWQIGVPSFRLEPLFRRQVPKLHSVLEHI
ncbi:protein PHOX1-like [Punica granatum]|uniref:Uncharacterized protein n=2 Tax=Punica granatum TaxID=22663 RepID=A0A2I0ISV9_PUNGR|nr:protein PHOX1-like [Punica granatum]PKI47091.1 hypothetical protein CRG98_032504 [Punica granatum]